MNPEQMTQAIEVALKLPLEQQAACILIAAEMSLPIWKQHCQEKQIVDVSDPFIQCFGRWLRKKASSQELDQIAGQLQATLPKRLSTEDKPYGGMAAWAVGDVAAIALDQCEDVHEDIFVTAIVYAARAYFRVGAVPTSISFDALSETELDFISDWWERC